MFFHVFLGSAKPKCLFKYTHMHTQPEASLCPFSRKIEVGPFMSIVGGWGTAGRKVVLLRPFSLLTPSWLPCQLL